MTKVNKVALIGMNGLSLELLRCVTESDLFTNLKKLLTGSISVDLNSHLQPAGAAAWTTIAAGVNPGKHGIFSNISRRPGAYKFSEPDGRLRRATPLWQIVNAYDYKVGVFNVPVSYPPDPINGFFIAGSDMPGPDSPFTYPNGLYWLIEQTFGFYKADVDRTLAGRAAYLEDILQLSTHQFEVCNFLLNKFPDIDFFFAVFTALDRLLRLFDWWFLLHQTEDESSTEDKVARQAIHHIFKKLDEMIGSLLRLDKNFNILLIAPHDHQPVQKQINLNEWLLETGFMSLDTSTEPSQPAPIDWSQTQAYSLGNYGHIYLNRRGREPLGIVEDGKEAKEVRRRIRGMLRRKFAETQPTADLNIWQAEDIYAGLYTSSAPDLIVDLPPGYIVIDTLLAAEPGFSANLESISPKLAPLFQHADRGLFLSNHQAGTDCQKKQIDLADIAPTVLALLNIPPPASMDGEPVYKIFGEVETPPAKMIADQNALLNVEALQQKVTELEEKLQLRQAELKAQQHYLTPLQQEVETSKNQIVVLKEEIEALRRGRVMRALLWQGRLLNNLKRKFNR